MQTHLRESTFLWSLNRKGTVDQTEEMLIKADMAIPAACCWLGAILPIMQICFHFNLQLPLLLALSSYQPFFNCYKRISISANKRNKEKLFHGIKKSFCYRQIFITGGSIIAGMKKTFIYEPIQWKENYQTNGPMTDRQGDIYTNFFL